MQGIDGLHAFGFGAWASVPHGIGFGRAGVPLKASTHRSLETQSEALSHSFDKEPLYWVLVTGSNLSYHNKETLLFTLDPYYGIMVT